MNEPGKYKILKSGQTPSNDPGATTRPFISEDGFLLVKTAEEFAGGTSATITNIDSGAAHDVDAGTFTYIGEAAAGSADSAAVWSITRVDEATGNTRLAGATNTKDKIWDNRTSLTYS